MQILRQELFMNVNKKKQLNFVIRDKILIIHFLIYVITRIIFIVRCFATFVAGLNILSFGWL